MESKYLSKSVNWLKYSTVSPEKYYLFDTIKCKHISATWEHFNINNIGPKHYIYGNKFYSKNDRKLRFHVFLENIWYCNFTWSGLIREKLWFLFKLWVLGTKFTTSCEFWKNMKSSGKKIKKHMESKLSGIFQLKLVAKNGIWFLRDPFYVCAD